VTNTSADWPSYLKPTTDAPADDMALDGVLQAFVVGVTNIPGSLVRPRWQPTPLPEPEVNTDWCAIGVTDEQPNENVAIVHDLSGRDFATRHERITAIATFYGPSARANAKRLRNALYVQQNRDMLRVPGLAVFDTSGPIGTAELINMAWRRRADLTLRFNRSDTQSYTVENILSAPMVVTTEDGATRSFVSPQGS